MKVAGWIAVGLVVVLNLVGLAWLAPWRHHERQLEGYAGSDLAVVRATRLVDTNMLTKEIGKAADVDATDRHGRQALTCAAGLGNLPAVRLLLDADADPEGDAIRRPIFAAISGQVAPDLEDVDDPLDVGAHHERIGEVGPGDARRIGIVRLLVGRGASLDGTVRAALWTAWTPTAEARMVDGLLALGADPNSQPARGRALPAVAPNAVGLPALLESLLAHGADPNGARPLAGLDAVVVVLLGTGTDVPPSVEALASNPPPEAPAPALVFAAIDRRNGPRQVRALLAAGADPDGSWGRYSALWVAVLARRVDEVRALVEAGAKVERPGKASPVDLAEEMGADDLLAILQG